MPTYSTEFKDNAVSKLKPPNSQSVEQVGQELSSPRSKLAAIIQSALINEAKHSEFCRERGLTLNKLMARKPLLSQQI